ncbi:conserved hypothetical protein [[Clostridium] ultunense Esp]|uniref:Uncharacterized protein n=1 Tax=[Clostridium] ultunense Esp TaxID=1288971 RepID=M1ZG70_9FIRM|nr:hypothetical protein [Schnuerera ultunensis]CCQ92732.1 conserved hypothetical protein [[Clostridium] ultunense Esp]SHD76210.1 conserved protein of unknown function [[Clostridium] ultunense Esp]
MLLKHIYNKYKIISIVGMAKNSGKTVALNHLIHEAIDEDIKLGIVSTGRDGESLDLVTETEKPKIFAEEGTIIATTTELLSLGDATVEIMNITEYRTPLGEILIGRVKDSGYIQISGPQTTTEIKEVASLMLKLGAEMVIIDGAIDRRSSAAPSITDATILSTGAVLSRDMNKVIEETIHIVNLFNLPQIKDSKEREILKKVLNKGDIAIIDKDSKTHPIGIKTALNCGHIIGDHIEDNSKYILIPGSLVKNTIEDIIRSTNKYKKVDIVVADGTKIFIPPKDWLRFMRYGVRVKVVNPINLVAITLNPYAPQGYYFEARELLDKTKYYIKDIPVVDLVLGGE